MALSFTALSAEVETGSLTGRAGARAREKAA
jgi:hypothetical protein